MWLDTLESISKGFCGRRTRGLFWNGSEGNDLGLGIVFWTDGMAPVIILGLGRLFGRGLFDPGRGGLEDGHTSFFELYRTVCDGMMPN